MYSHSVLKQIHLLPGSMPLQLDHLAYELQPYLILRLSRKVHSHFFQISSSADLAKNVLPVRLSPVEYSPPLFSDPHSLQYEQSTDYLMDVLLLHMFSLPPPLLMRPPQVRKPSP